MILPVATTPELFRLENETDFCDDCDDYMLLDFENEVEEGNKKNHREKLKKLSLQSIERRPPTPGEESFARSLMAERAREPIKKEAAKADEVISLPTSIPTNDTSRSSVVGETEKSTRKKRNDDNGKCDLARRREESRRKNNILMKTSDHSFEGDANRPPSTSSSNTSDSESCSDSVRSNNELDTEETSGSTKVEIPSKFDILCGQSRICATHTGNRRFQVVLDIYVNTYQKAITKQEKMALTKEIVACISSSGGRFLKYIRQEEVWQEIASVTARDKVSHALRTKVASLKRQREQQQKEEQAHKTSRHDGIKGRLSCKRSLSESSKATSKKGRTLGQNKPRRTSSSIQTSTSDTSRSSTMDELLRAQREIFASLTRGESISTSPPTKRRTDQSKSPPQKRKTGKRAISKLKTASVKHKKTPGVKPSPKHKTNEARQPKLEMNDVKGAVDSPTLARNM